MVDNPDKSISADSSLEHSSDISKSDARTLAEYGKTILTNQTMLMGYAVAIIVLAFGLVLLIILLAVLCFFHPEKVNAFLLLLGGPVAVLVLGHTIKLTISSGANGESQNKR